MGKRIEDLDVDDTPIPAPEPVDERTTTWFKFLVEIDELVESGDYDWALQVLQGIYATVEQKHWVTEGQRQAVANIEAGASKRLRRKGSRRYESWR